MIEDLTLYGFLEQTGADVRVYDTGRRVRRLDRDLFLGFEHGTTPYPLPLQHKAWFALVQASADGPAQPVIWFLRLGLDEQGLLVQAERDYLLGRLLDSARAHTGGDDAQAFLQDNPYAFTPREDRMALFHSLLSVDLGLPPSRFYHHALAYFRGEPGWDQWSFVGYQGIADVACRHSDTPLTAAIGHLPDEPLIALCHCLECRPAEQPLAAALLQRLDRTMHAETGHATVIAALVRALSCSIDNPAVVQALLQLLDHPSSRHIEILAAISGRAWELLTDTRAVHAYLRQLADNDHGQAAFEQCLGDLLSLPSMAGPVRRALRSPTLDPDARKAFGRMTAAKR